MSKNPSWIQFSDDAWGEAVGPTEYDSFLDSLDGPTIPAQSLEPLPDHDAPLLLTWITEHLAELAADEQFRVIGLHGLTFQRHAEMLAEVARLDAVRRAAVGDLRDQIARQHREAKQELDDFERSPQFQTALRHYLDAAGPAFEHIATATPENQAAVVYQQQAAARYEGLKALIAPPSGTQSQPIIIEQASPPSQRGQGKQKPAARQDDMAIEIEDVVIEMEKGGRKVSSASVMASLKARAGRPESCITEAISEGVIWVRGSSNQPEKLTTANLRDRLKRR